MKLLTLVFLLLSIVPSFAGINDPTWNPPKRYDHAYTGKLIEHDLPQDKLVNVCAAILGHREYNQHGCSTGDRNGVCTIYIVNKTFMQATPKAIRRHEIGHCNGWNATHSN